MDWNRSLCNTCRQNLSVVKARADPQTSICTRPYKILLIRRREKRNQSIGRMGPTFPQCHLNSRQTNHKYGIGPHEQYGRHAGNGCRQYAPCIISEHPGCIHLGGNASLCRLCRMESVCGKHNTDRPAVLVPYPEKSTVIEKIMPVCKA